MGIAIVGVNAGGTKVGVLTGIFDVRLHASPKNKTNPINSRLKFIAPYLSDPTIFFEIFR